MEAFLLTALGLFVLLLVGPFLQRAYAQERQARDRAKLAAVAVSQRDEPVAVAPNEPTPDETPLPSAVPPSAPPQVDVALETIQPTADEAPGPSVVAPSELSSELPRSVAEALAPHNDRAPPDGSRRYVIGYLDDEGQTSFRVISRVVRQQATFSARCHLADGQRRMFAFDRLAGIFDAGSGDAISLDAFRDNKQRRKAAAPG